MDRAAVLAAFNEQTRRNPPAEPGTRVERDGSVVRIVDGDGYGWEGVVWSDLDDSTAGEAIARQVAYFGERRFEWKLYDYDAPADLRARLLRAGFVPEEPEALMIGEVAALPREPMLPDGVRLEVATD